MVIASDTINSSATKFVEITVNRQSTQLKKPSIITTDNTDVVSGKTTKRMRRKMTANNAMMKTTIAEPNTTKSFWINRIMSEVTMVTPPTKISASPLYFSAMSLTDCTRTRERCAACVLYSKNSALTFSSSRDSSGDKPNCFLLRRNASRARTNSINLSSTSSDSAITVVCSSGPRIKFL